MFKSMLGFVKCGVLALALLAATAGESSACWFWGSSWGYGWGGGWGYPYYGYGYGYPYYGGGVAYWPGYCGYYPYWGYYGYWPGTYFPFASAAPAANKQATATATADEGTTTHRASYTPAEDSTPKNTALFEVRLPDPEAKVWFNNGPTTRTGATREYITPELTPGRTYTYQIRARWMSNGQPVTESRQIEVQAGQHKKVTFAD